MRKRRNSLSLIPPRWGREGLKKTVVFPTGNGKKRKGSIFAFLLKRSLSPSHREGKGREQSIATDYCTEKQAAS